jgi:hypothetical protein
MSVAALTALAPDHPVSIIPHAQAEGLKDSESDALCPRGNATLRGNYMSMGGGTVVGVGPVAFVGKLTYDGNGNVTNPFTLSYAGTILQLTDYGTYVVNSDCTGTHTSGNGSQHYSFLVSPDGSKIDYIETDTGTVISGSASRVKD